MIVKRKLYSVMDEEGNLGYYLYNEATGEEKLFSVVEEEKEFTSVRHFKKALNTNFEKAAKGNLTTKDAMRMVRTGKLVEGNSPKSVNNPNFEKVAKGPYSKFNKLFKGELEKGVSKPEFVNQLREDLNKLCMN